jgi:hypothetical protein
MSSVVWLLYVAVTGYDAILSSIESGARLNYASIHPNALGYVFAGFVPAQLWGVLQARRALTKSAALLLMVGSVLLIVLASSRGSLVSIAAAAIILFIVIGARTLRLRTGARYVGVGGILLVIGILGVTYSSSRVVADSVRSIMLVDDPYRGLDSGMTGRSAAWANATYRLVSGRWITGYGFRTATETIDADIDNGYITLWFELGLLPATVITLWFVYIWMCGIRAAVIVQSRLERNTTFALTGFLTIVLVNNIFARYLFGIGNPTSLLGIILFAAPSARIIFVAAKSDYDARTGSLLRRIASPIRRSAIERA